MAHNKGSVSRIQALKAGTVRGRVVGSNINFLQRQFQPPESEKDFIKWRNLPITKLMIGAIREIGMVPEIASMDAVDPVVSFGFTQGCSLSAQLLDDPSAIYNWLFRELTPELSGDPPMEYSSAPDDAEFPEENNA